MYVYISGLETDYVLKANEKSVLRVDLTELYMEDLMEDTLYKKVFLSVCSAWFYSAVRNLSIIYCLLIYSYLLS